MKHFKSILFCFLLIQAALQTAAGQNFVKLTDKTYPDFIKNNPVVFLTFTTDCDLGQYYIDGLQKSVEGIHEAKYAYLYYDSGSETLSGLPYGDLGTVYLMINAEVKGQFDEWGTNNIRKAISENLKKNNIATKLTIPDNDRESSKIRTGSVNLKQNLIASFPFDKNSPKDTSGNSNDLYLQEDSVSIENNMYKGTGVYTYNAGGTVVFQNEKFNKGFTVSGNFQIEDDEEGRGKNHNILYCVRYRTIEVSIREKNLEITIDMSPIGGDWYYRLFDTNIEFSQWNHLTISMTEDASRMHIILNGKVLEDIVFDPLMISQFKDFINQETLKLGEYSWNLSNDVSFYNYGYGGVYHGLIDDFMIYNRPINKNEAVSLYDTYSKDKKTINKNLVSEQNFWKDMWITSWGGTDTILMNLTESGDSISGTYDFKNGKVTAKALLENNTPVMKGDWSQDGKNGWLVFRMNSDNNSFDGEWGYTSGKRVGFWSGERQKGKITVEKTRETYGKMFTVDEKQFRDWTKDSLVFVDFYADWCGPCRNFSPMFEKTAASVPSHRFLKLDIDAHSNIADEYNVDFIPFIVALKNGKVVAQFEQERNFEAYYQWCLSVIQKNDDASYGIKGINTPSMKQSIQNKQEVVPRKVKRKK